MSRETHCKLKVVEQSLITANSRVKDSAVVNFYDEVDGCKIFVVNVEFLPVIDYSSPDSIEGKLRKLTSWIIDQKLSRVISWIDGTDLRIGDSKRVITYAKVDLSEFVSDGEIAKSIRLNSEAHGIVVGSREAVDASTARFLGNEDLRGSEDACGATVEKDVYAGGFPKETIHCERGVGHHGNHYVFTEKMNYKWGDKGGHALSGNWRTPFGVPAHCGSCGMASIVSTLEAAGRYSALCNDCRFWLEPTEGRIVVDSEQYSRSVGMPGFSGRDFHIEFFDATLKDQVFTLSHQGTIPRHLRGEIPDNAKFIK